MLTRFHKILIGALAVQMVLALIVLTRGDDSAALKEHTLLPGFDAAKVTRLQVFAPDASKPDQKDSKKDPKDAAKPIDLVKRDANWVLASGFDYPVEQSKLNDVLSPIAKLAAAAPIATQASRHTQLKVADGEFERKLVITADGKDITLYIGSAAGARRTAVRIGGDDNVYAVTGITAFAAGSEPRQWIDTAYVKIPRDEVGRLIVQRDDKKVEMTKSAPPPPAGAGSGSAAGSGSGSGAGSGSAEGTTVPPPSPPAAEHWSAAIGGAPVTLATGESIDEAVIDRLVNAAAMIDLSGPADPKRDASKPTATITLERKPAGTSTPAPTVIDVIAEGNSYWVHDRSLPRAGMVDKARLDELLDVDRDKVVKKPPPPPPPGKGAGSGSAAAIPGLPPGMLGMPGAAHPPVAPPPAKPPAKPPGH